MRSRTSSSAPYAFDDVGRALFVALRADFNRTIQHDLIEVGHQCIDPHLPLSRYREHQIIDAPSALVHADGTPLKGFNAG